MKYNQLIFQLFLFCFIIKSSLNRIPKEFVYINDIDPTIKVNLKYYGKDNFIGRRVPHYKANIGIKDFIFIVRWVLYVDRNEIVPLAWRDFESKFSVNYNLIN